MKNVMIFPNNVKPEMISGQNIDTQEMLSVIQEVMLLKMAAINFNS